MDVVAEVKRAGGVATIRLQSGEEIKAPSALYLERRVRPGQAIDADAYRAFIRDKGYPHALKAAVDFLSLRERSEQEIVQRLRRVHFHETTIARVMETLAGHHLYSDERFAENWVHKRAKKYGELNGFAEEMLTGSRTISAYGRCEVISSRFNKINGDTMDAYRDAEHHAAMLFPTINFINNL